MAACCPSPSEPTTRAGALVRTPRGRLPSRSVTPPPPSLPDRLEGTHANLDGIEPLHLQRSGGGRVYFVSDIHLGDGTHADVFLEKDADFLAFLDEVEQNAEALIIVGDALDFEQAWYFSRIVKAHPEVVSRLTKLAQSMRVVYVYGNHDPDVVLFRDILHWELCSRVIVDGHILAVHGWEFDTYVGRNFEQSHFLTRMMNLYERAFRTWIRLPLSQYYTRSNRFVHWLFSWLARGNAVLRKAGARWGRPELGRGLQEWIAFWTRAELGDPMGISGPAMEAVRNHPELDLIICGHSHVPGNVPLAGDNTFVNLGSWSFGNSQYGWWDGEEFRLRDWITGRSIGAENYRPILEGWADRTYLEWFEDEYLGYFKFRCGEEALRKGVRPRPWALERLEHDRLRTTGEHPAPR